MASSSSSGLTFKLHPLVIVNISDHYTRIKSQSQPPPTSSVANDAVSSPPPPRVFDCVIGIQRSRTVEIFNSFELLNFLMCVRGVIVILGFYGRKLIIGVSWDADKKVFPHFYVLGWYSTGSDAQETDMQIHKTRRE
ncbi:COP9 signalosome complex subunit 6a [Forsythia ovata]|uniref:COP9 signalosome complex subunit 6a n=1 Tax=Forsythia ovata TaxID=205694 RepID=A0ABD1SK87_9LAMI